MNLAFYLAIDRLPLGTAVAIEFSGPVAVAALGSRTQARPARAGTRRARRARCSPTCTSPASPAGVAFALTAGALWAVYIVLGHRVASDPGIRPQDGLAAGMALGAIVLAPFLVSEAVPGLTDVGLLLASIAVGLASSVVPYVLEQVAMRRLSRGPVRAPPGAAPGDRGDRRGDRRWARFRASWRPSGSCSSSPRRGLETHEA